MLTTTPMPVTTASPTTMAVVTTQAPQQTTTAAAMVTTQAPQPTTTAATVDMHTTMPVVTAAHVSTEAPSMFKLYNQRL